ncbi:putative flavin carrier protein 3 [Wickerhamomyces ciferrii]|uniref:Flavin carrier protein 3 n=1 Tax=Wickerhamomyces ciferrii (strain ATCC 14091 / BCRC 22168 / CBS 111 / JCM 3599 / NBRC 0793 / NRRL Y-1031 F-60-10) TaxID=1206466 RepID=K0KSG3_WICCF|nr:putative flavin carrier protein 3 [Wickerhamomyces ciferrii]CCH44982.1 putative flavin carrier protein 3 [Wickerhamomyces ciferrii]
MRFNLFLIALSQIIPFTQARVLKASSLVTCMENSQLSATYFDVLFKPDDGSLHYTLDFTSEISDYIIADLDVYAYGFKIITRQIDLCSLGWKQFCPLFPGQVEVDSIEYISKEYINQIPGIAYQVPDIDAFARVKVKNSNGTQVACIQAYFTNGHSVSQTGAKWATAVIAGLGLLTSAIASAFGNSNAASHVGANAVSLFLYFQSIVVLCMQHVDQVPPIASAWAENLAWSMGLIRVTFMQRIFRWYVQSTGGTPTLNLTSKTINILVQRSVDYVKRGMDLLKRDKPVVIYGNHNVLIFRGIKRLAYLANIETTSVVCTGFTFFIIFGYVLVGVIFIVKYASELFIRLGWIKSYRLIDFRQNWKQILKGSLSRYIFIGFTQLMILSLWEFVQRDSPAVIVLAILFLILALGILGWSCFRVISFAKKSISIHKNPAAILYGDDKILDKYGFFYTMFNAKRYWWGAVVLGHTIIKAIFIAFCQGSGKTSAMVFWIVDMVYLGLLIHFKPYLNSPTNIVNIMIQTVITINSFLFVFYSNLFGQPAAVASVMGWVFFILNAAFTVILLVLLLLGCGFIIFSKNPDTRFKPAKDDRASFQKFSNHTAQKGPTAELMALGIAAKDHSTNWENELQDMKRSTLTSTQNQSSSTQGDEDSSVPIADNEKETFTGKVVRKLTGGRSLKRNKSQKKTNEKRLLSDSSYLPDHNNQHNNNDEDGFDFDEQQPPLPKEQLENYHQKHESISSFNHVNNRLQNDDITQTNDFIGGSNNQSGTNLNHVQRYSQDSDDVPYRKI